MRHSRFMPRIVPSSDCLELITQAQRTIGMSQRQLGELVGASRRTITRWFGGGSTPELDALQAIARAVYPHDASLAAALAAETGQTLVSLGIEMPPPPPAPVVVAAPPPPELAGPPARPFPPARLVVDSIVCAAAESMQCAPSAVRDVLRAAFARARGLGLTLEEVEEGLRGAEARVAEKGATKGASRGTAGERDDV
ncbi:MAG TPA: helix-turn-helix transcriptional regulator [Polyangiaceae bacterium]